MTLLRTYLCRYRKTHALSQEQMAHRAGLSVPTYRRLEAFPRPDAPTPVASSPTLRTFAHVLRAIGAEAEFLAALDVALSDARHVTTNRTELAPDWSSL